MLYTAHPDIQIPADFQQIPQFPVANYNVTVPWYRLDDHIKANEDSFGFVLEPDFQRGHVWTAEQQIAYVEFVLMGGRTSRVVICAAKDWNGLSPGSYELVDGLQRITAARAFVHGEIPAFGHFYQEYKTPLRPTTAFFDWMVVNTPTRLDRLRLYLQINAGGTPHAPEEIARIQALIREELAKGNGP